MKAGKLLVFLIIISILVSGCLGTRYLKPNEKILAKQKTITSKAIDVEEIEEIYSQTPNRQLPILPFSPYVWFYHIGIKNYDIAALEEEKQRVRTTYDSLITSTEKPRKKRRFTHRRNRKLQKIDKAIKEGNVLMRWGEPLAIYDDVLTQATLQNMQVYLSSKGYFNAKVNHSIKVRKSKVRSVFEINEGRPHLIDTLLQKVGDSTLVKLLSNRKSNLKSGAKYDQQMMTKERTDIDDHMKNNGYYNFSREYISFDVDTTYKDHKVALRTVIKNPANASGHKRYTIDSVNFVINEANRYANDSVTYHQAYRGVKYSAHAPYYKPKILSRRVFVHRNDLYNKKEVFETQRQLANLDIFKFININFDSTDGQFIANIFTRPLPRYQWTNEFGINVNQGFPGPFYNTTFKKRNVFRGLENFELSGRIGIEGIAPATELDDPYRSIEAGINASLIFPQFVFPIRESIREKLGHLNPKTRFSVGYTLTDRPEYKRKNANFTTTYSWGKQQNTLYKFSLTDLSIIDSELSNDFDMRLQDLALNGSNLINAFRPSLVSSMSFSVIKNFNNYGFVRQNSSYLQLFVETGGTTQNWFSNTLLESQGWESYKFLKFNIDYRKIRPISKNAEVAFRLNTGIAIPYGDNEILPYEKYFFAGGSNGIRGWRPRRLGPGAHTPLNGDGEINYQFEQNGEVLIQSSVEFRQNLFGFVDWAYFIDAGNIWTINEDTNRPGAQFKSESFFKEIAIASGLGLRFDFVFLIVRFDAGLKVLDPARPEGKRFIFSKGFDDAPFDDPQNTEPVIFNIGIGYPF